MKKPMILIFSIMLLAACSGGKADYGKTITEHLLSKVPAGRGYDVEILDIERLPPVTVADSIAVLQAAFEKDRNDKLNHFSGLMGLVEMLPNGDPFRQNREKAVQNSIDSLERLSVPVFYGDVPPDRVLALAVRCWYAATVPLAPRPMTETFDFWLTPDGDEVLYQRKAK